jgi:hypothetical protein
MAGVRPYAKLKVDVLPSRRQYFAATGAGQKKQPDRVRRRLIGMLLERTAKPLDFFG